MTGNKRVLLIGPAPENVGGISVHLRRLMSIMKGLCQFDFIDESSIRRPEYFNIRSLNFFTYFKKVFRAQVVHINSGSMWLRIFNVFACFLMRKYIVVTVHRDPQRDRHLWLTRMVLSMADVVIAVNEKGRDVLMTGTLCEYMFLPAFIPPNLDDEPQLNPTVASFVNRVRLKPGNVLMVNNASAITFYDGYELYGVHFCLKMMQRLCASSDKYYLVFVIVKSDEPQLLEAIYKWVSDNNLQDHVLLVDDAHSFVRLMTKSDIVLRTTNTDGDSLTVREALTLGVPVIASDCVPRPDGTILYKTHDVDDIINVIKNTVSRPEPPQREKALDYVAVYSKIYRL